MAKPIAATRCDWCYHIEQSEDLKTIKYLGRCTLAPGHDGDHLHAWPHIYKRCTRSECDQDCDGDGQVHRFGHVSDCAYVACGGCRADTGMDCMYEALSCCAVCDCYEGSLLPFCPGRKVSYDESQVFYEHYCAGTGPFARRTFKNVEAADLASFDRLYEDVGSMPPPRAGQHALRAAILDLHHLPYVCAICSKLSKYDVTTNTLNGGVVEPAHEWICNPCLVRRFAP